VKCRGRARTAQADARRTSSRLEWEPRAGRIRHDSCQRAIGHWACPAEETLVRSCGSSSASDDARCSVRAANNRRAGNHRPTPSQSARCPRRLPLRRYAAVHCLSQLCCGAIAAEWAIGWIALVLKAALEVAVVFDVCSFFDGFVSRGRGGPGASAEARRVDGWCLSVEHHGRVATFVWWRGRSFATARAESGEGRETHTQDGHGALDGTIPRWPSVRCGGTSF